MREQRALASEPLFEPLMAALGVIAIARQMAARQCIGDIREFGADCARYVEGYFFHGRDDSNRGRRMHRLLNGDIVTAPPAVQRRMQRRGTTNRAYCRQADSLRR